MFNFQALSGTNAGGSKRVMVRALVYVMGNSARPLKNTLNMLIVKVTSTVFFHMKSDSSNCNETITKHVFLGQPDGIGTDISEDQLRTRSGPVI